MGLLNSLQIKPKEGARGTEFDEQIKIIEGKIRDQLVALGTIYMELHREDYESACERPVIEIRTLEQEKNTLEKNKLASQGLRLCEQCRQIISLDSVFCNKCGAKLTPLAVASENGKYCKSCGTLLEEGDLFCVKCGARVNDSVI